jgi:hypothetical protein
MKIFINRGFAVFFVFFVCVSFIRAQDAVLPFPQVAFAPSVTHNASLPNEVNFIHKGCSFTSNPYTDCYTYDIGNTLRVDNNTDFLLIRTPNTTINQLDITISAGNTTPVVAVIAFSADSITWSNFQELDAFPKNAIPSCMRYSLRPPDGMKFFKMMRVGFEGYEPVGAVGVTSIVVFDMSVWTGITYDVSMIRNDELFFKVSPNPTQNDVTISYEVKQKSHNKVIISNLLGQPVAVLQDGIQPTGEYSLHYNCSSLANGIYLITHISGDNCITKKLIRK